MEHAIFNTVAGWVGVESSAKGLSRLILPRKTPQEAAGLLGIPAHSAITMPPQLEDIVKRLQSYFSGHTVSFPDMLDFSGTTEFQRKVWEATRLIPYGETRSYAWIAVYISNSRAARAVGNALRRNPLPIIVPCHRVLESGGGLGGFSGRVDLKKYLLKLESGKK